MKEGYIVHIGTLSVLANSQEHALELLRLLANTQPLESHFSEKGTTYSPKANQSYALEFCHDLAIKDIDGE